VQQVILNACRWAAPHGAPEPIFGNRKPLESF